ncbi:MAG: hypothetical protein FWF02_07840 [Micrococcales bacterium]|nr:hypothetical protein [Micrococcales bacterium]MCL2667602.1 hypothetical protein [Micrococcales bacterium]
MVDPTAGWPETSAQIPNDLSDEPLGWPPQVGEVPLTWPGTMPDDAPVGWPEHLGQQPFDEASPVFVIDEQASPPVPAVLAEEVLSAPTIPTEHVVNGTQVAAGEPTGVDQAEETHLHWLRTMPERHDDEPAAQTDRPVPQESPRRQWIERIVVGLLAGVVTVAATHLAGAEWLTAGWIGASVLVVVPLVAWVATLGQRSSTKKPKATSKVGT